MNKLPLIYWGNKISLRKSAGQTERLSSLLAQSTIDLNPHQLRAALFAFNSPLSRGAILADEVGLGKTIEAGLVISQLWIENKRRILIIVPASLRTQWREELELHFNLQSTVLDTKYFEDQVNSGQTVPMTEEGIYIASIHFVHKRLKLIRQQPWDVVIIDEAHRLRRVYRGRDASKMAFDLREALQDKPKLLLTATPLQNDLMELYGLISFIDDKLLGAPYYFKTRFVDSLKDQTRDITPTLKEVRKLILGDEDDDDFANSTGVVFRTLRKQAQPFIKMPFTPRNSMTVDFNPTEQEAELYKVVSDYLQRDKLAAIEHTQRNLMILVYRKLLASSSFAISPTLKKLADRLEEELKIRKKEGDTQDDEKNGNLLELEEFIEESEEYGELEDVEEPPKTRAAKGFSDEEIQQEVDELHSYYDLAVSIKENRKGQALINSLNNVFTEAKKKGWPAKAVVFTESRRTQEYLKKLLAGAGITTTLLNGSNNSKESKRAYENWQQEFPELALSLSKKIAMRQALTHEFKTRTQIFLTTEAGAEGLNLQFSNIVVNFDLPWNPQRVEQRIGRCHRYGQRYEVLVINMLNTKNHADKRLLELLQEKLSLFEGVFGASDEILGALGEGVDFEKRILGIYQGCKTPEEIDAAFEELKKDMAGERQDSVKDITSKVIEYLDSPLMQLFKQTDEEVREALNDYDRSLLELCKVYFKDKIQATDDLAIFKIESDGKTRPYLFREETEEEYGKIQRMHNDHPIIEHILAEVRASHTKPIPVVKINYSESGKKMHSVDGAQGKTGFLYLFKLVVEGIEVDEALAPLFFIEEDGKFDALDLQTGQFLIELPIEDTDETIEKSPLSKDELFEEWHKWKKQAVERFEKRNERLYTREQARIERYWDSQTLKNQDKIDKVEKEIKELKRKKSSTIDFEQIREFAQKIQKAEIRLQKLKIERTKIETEALDGKQKDFDELNRKLEMEKREELLAVAKFTII